MKFTNQLRFLVTFVIITQIRSKSEERLCVDDKCTENISLGKATRNYAPSKEGILAFKAGVEMRIKSKSPDSDLWGVEIDGKYGYAPKMFIQETRVFHKNDLIPGVPEIPPPKQVKSKLKSSENSKQVPEVATTTAPLPANLEGDPIISKTEVPNKGSENITPAPTVTIVDGTEIPIGSTTENKSSGGKDAETFVDDEDDDDDDDDDDEPYVAKNDFDAEKIVEKQKETPSNMSNENVVQNEQQKQEAYAENNPQISPKTNKPKENPEEKPVSITPPFSILTPALVKENVPKDEKVVVAEASQVKGTEESPNVKGSQALNMQNNDESVNVPIENQVSAASFTPDHLVIRTTDTETRLEPQNDPIHDQTINPEGNEVVSNSSAKSEQPAAELNADSTKSVDEHQSDSVILSGEPNKATLSENPDQIVSNVQIPDYKSDNTNTIAPALDVEVPAILSHETVEVQTEPTINVVQNVPSENVERNNYEPSIVTSEEKPIETKLTENLEEKVDNIQIPDTKPDNTNTEAPTPNVEVPAILSHETAEAQTEPTVNLVQNVPSENVESNNYEPSIVTSEEKPIETKLTENLEEKVDNIQIPDTKPDNTNTEAPTPNVEVPAILSHETAEAQTEPTVNRVQNVLNESPESNNHEPNNVTSLEKPIEATLTENPEEKVQMPDIKLDNTNTEAPTLNVEVPAMAPLEPALSQDQNVPNESGELLEGNASADLKVQTTPIMEAQTESPTAPNMETTPPTLGDQIDNAKTASLNAQTNSNPLLTEPSASQVPNTQNETGAPDAKLSENNLEAEKLVNADLNTQTVPTTEERIPLETTVQSLDTLNVEKTALEPPTAPSEYQALVDPVNPSNSHSLPASPVSEPTSVNINSDQDNMTTKQKVISKLQPVLDSIKNRLLNSKNRATKDGPEPASNSIAAVPRANQMHGVLSKLSDFILNQNIVQQLSMVHVKIDELLLSNKGNINCTMYIAICEQEDNCTTCVAAFDQDFSCSACTGTNCALGGSGSYSLLQGLGERSCPSCASIERESCTSFDHSTKSETDFVDSMYQKVLELFDVLCCVIISAATTLLFTFGYYCISQYRREHELIAKLNVVERSLLASNKEASILKHELVETCDKLASIENNSFGSNDMVMAIKRELDISEESRARLEEQVASLEKELETAAEAGLELNKIVSELLSNQSGDESIISSVEELQRQLNEQQNTIFEINSVLADKSRENSELQLILAEQNAKFNSEISSLQQDNDELEAEKSALASKIDEMKAEFEQDITKALEGKNSEIKRLQSGIFNLEKKYEEEHRKWQTSVAKIEALEECLKAVKRDPNVKISQIIDAANVQAELLTAQREREALKEKLESALDARKMLEEKVKANNDFVEKMKHDFQESEKDKLEAQTRLEVLSNYFKEKETQLQKELSLKEAMWLKQQGETTSTVDRLTSMQEEIQMLKSQNDSLRAEIEAQQAAHKAQIGTLENRAHETWLTARQSERRFEEARSEATALRRKLTAMVGGNTLGLTKENNPDVNLPPSDLNNASSPVHMESPSSPILGRLPPPLPFMPGPFIPPPPPHFMGIPPFMPPGELRPPPMGRLMSPPLPPGAPHLHRYSPIDDEDLDDDDDDEIRESSARGHWRDTYSPPRHSYRYSPDRYAYNSELISNYDTETDFSPPGSPRGRSHRSGSRSGSYKAYSPPPQTASNQSMDRSKKSSKGQRSSGSEKSFSSWKGQNKGMV